MNIFQTILFLVGGVAITLIGDVFLKKSQLTNFTYLAIGIILYALVALPVAAAFKYQQFGVVILLWQAIIITAGVILGTLVFKEPITLLKLAAFLTALATVVLSYLATR